MNDPLISIIVTTKNLVETGQAKDFNLLVSLLSLQTYSNIELLVMDAASTDGTIDFLQKYKNRGLLNFHSEPDNGKFDAYNKAINFAKGEYLAFITCDDFYHDITGILDVVNVIKEENPDYILTPAYCRHRANFVFLFVPSIHNTFQVMPCSRQCMFFKKSVVQSLGGFDIQFEQMSDYDLMIRLALGKYKYSVVNRNIMTYMLGKHLFEEQEVGISEAKLIFKKNYDGMYEFTDTLLDDMVRTSDFPKELLDKLVDKFPPEEKDLFYERCEQMHNIRVNAKGQ